MGYKAEPLETNFGKGIKIEKDRRSYEQFSCKEGLFVRVYQLPEKDEDGRLVNTDYHGAIFRAHFQDTNQDYEQFRVLTERLQQASGEEVPNSKAQFMDYISHSGLEQELSRIGANVRINLKNRKDLPEAALSWINLKSHLGGLVSDVALYLGGFALLANACEGKDLVLELPFYGIIVPVGEAIFGLVGGGSGDAPWRWCGPLHAPAFVPSWFFYKDTPKHPTYILNKFIQNYQRLEAMGTSVENQRQYAKQSKKVDRYFGVLKSMFPFTKHQRGFSITYDSPNRDNVISFFDYVLEGGNVPQLPNPRTGVKNKKPRIQKEPVKIEPVETNFINPWEVQIPKL